MPNFDSLPVDIILLINLFIPPYMLRQYAFLSKKIYFSLQNSFFLKQYCDHYITTNLELLPKNKEGRPFFLRELFRIKEGYYLGFMGYETYIRRNYRRYLPRRRCDPYSILDGVIAGHHLNIVITFKNWGVDISVAKYSSFLESAKNMCFDMVDYLFEMNYVHKLLSVFYEAVEKNVALASYMIKKSENHDDIKLNWPGTDNDESDNDESDNDESYNHKPRYWYENLSDYDNSDDESSENDD